MIGMTTGLIDLERYVGALAPVMRRPWTCFAKVTDAPLACSDEDDGDEER